MPEQCRYINTIWVLYNSRNITHCNYLTTPFMNQPSYPRSHIAKHLKSQLWSIQKNIEKYKASSGLKLFSQSTVPE
ncbi:hypothetical protein Hanom_Chr04g00321511 [Helianthus anomalus]